MLQNAEEIVRENHFVEFRLDYLANPAAILPKLKQFLYERGEVTAIATCRRAATGGKFKGTIAAELEILEKAAQAGCHLIDIELQTAEHIKPAQMKQLRSHGAALIISYHDFEGTKDLDAIFDRIHALPAGVREDRFDREDALGQRDHDALPRSPPRRSEHHRHLHGRTGNHQPGAGPARRAACLRLPRRMPAKKPGPGRLTRGRCARPGASIRSTQSTKVYGVAGNPVRHSLSPLMHNMAFRRETVNGVFLPLQTTRLNDLLTLTREVPLHGLAITMPFKSEIIKHLEKTDALSEKIGACNTVVRAQDGKLYGFNTDVAAVVRPLERRLPLSGAKILVLGAGGAGRAAVFGLVGKRRGSFRLEPHAGDSQEAGAPGKGEDHPPRATGEDRASTSSSTRRRSGCAASSRASLLEPKELNARLVFDLVYNPIDTPLIRMAREKGLPVVTGVEMFVHQGARQFEIWTGKPAPEEEMLRVVVHALRQESAKLASS